MAVLTFFGQKEPIGDCDLQKKLREINQMILCSPQEPLNFPLFIREKLNDKSF
jgi:hypothetical protein